MHALYSTKDDCYKNENYPHIVARSEKVDFETIFKKSISNEPFLDMMSEFSDQEGKFADSIVLVHYTKEHVEQYPYLSTFDSEDFEKICKKYPNAYKIEVFNIKNFRELCFITLFDETD